MKHVTLFFLTMFAIPAYGQDKSKDSTSSDFKKIQIGISLSPDICYRTLHNNAGSAAIDGVIEQRNETETVKVGYTAGLSVRFNFQPTMGLETGIHYSNKGYQHKMMDVRYREPEPDSPTKAKSRYNFHYLDIPLKATFTFGQKNVRFFTSAGVTTSIFIKTTRTSISVYGDRTKRKSNSTDGGDYKRVNISPTLSVGIDYKISNRMNLRMEPTFQYGVLQINDTPLTTRLYSGGLMVSCYVGL